MRRSTFVEAKIGNFYYHYLKFFEIDHCFWNWSLLLSKWKKRNCSLISLQWLFFLLLDGDGSGRLRFYPRLQQGMEAVQRGHGQGELQRWFVWNNRQSCAYTAVLAAELTRVFKEVVDTWHCFNLCLRVGKASLRKLPEQVLGCCSTWWSPAC